MKNLTNKSVTKDDILKEGDVIYLPINEEIHIILKYNEHQSIIYGAPAYDSADESGRYGGVLIDENYGPIIKIGVL